MDLNLMSEQGMTIVLYKYSTTDRRIQRVGTACGKK